MSEFDIVLAGCPKSPTRRRIHRQVYGDDYPEEADPTSYITLIDLRRIARELRVGPGQTFVDLGCGRGGPGLRIALETGAELIGIDISQIGIELATQQVAVLDIAGRARFQVGDFVATGLPSAAFDGAMSVDVLQGVKDKSAAVREVARILRPGARFAFTTWDSDLPEALPTWLTDHGPLLQDAGFIIQTYEETSGGNARHRALYEAVRAAQADLAAEMGEAAARMWLGEGDWLTGWTDGIDRLAHIRHILVVAQKV